MDTNDTPVNGNTAVADAITNAPGSSSLGADVQAIATSISVNAVGTPEERLTALETQVAALTYGNAAVTWLHAELMWKSKKAMAARIMSDPAIRERMEQALIAGMDRPQDD